MIVFESQTAAIGKYVTVKQDTGIITFAEVKIDTGSYNDYTVSHRDLT